MDIGGAVGTFEAPPRSHTGSQESCVPRGTQFLAGFQPEAVLSHLSPGPLHRAALNMAAAGFIGPGKPESFYNLRRGIPSLLHFAFIRGESQALPTP